MIVTVAAARADPRRPAAVLARPGDRLPQPRVVRRRADPGPARPAAPPRRDGDQPARSSSRRACPSASGTPGGTSPRFSAPTRTRTAFVANATAGVALVLQSMSLQGRRRDRHDRSRLRRRRAWPSTHACARDRGHPHGRADPARSPPTTRSSPRSRGPITPGRTRLLIVDQITSASARLMPVARLAAAARQRDVAGAGRRRARARHARHCRSPRSAPTSGSATCTSGCSRRGRPALLSVAAHRRARSSPLVVVVAARRRLPDAAWRCRARSTTPRGWPRRPAST